MKSSITRIAIAVTLAGLYGIACAASAIAANQAKPLEAWVVDPLVKVFREATPVAGIASADEARGQTATFQIVVRGRGNLTGLRCDVGRIEKQSSPEASLGGAVVRYVGYVPVDRALRDPPKDRVHKLPADFPDPLFDHPPTQVKAGEAQPIWITLKIPLDCQPGVYRGEAKISARVNGTNERLSVPLKVTVYNATVKHTRLWVTNWFQVGAGYNPMPKKYSPEFWQMLRLYARDMAAHRQTVVRTVPLELAQYKFDSSGNIQSIDWSRMDQWVQIFIDEGVVGRIGGQQIGWRGKKWKSAYVVSTYVPVKEGETARAELSGNPYGIAEGGVQEVRVAPTSAEAVHFYSRFLPLLQQHIIQKGWVNLWMQHVADEPDNFDVASYRQVAALLKKYAPKLRRMDAILTPKVADSVDVLVPLLDILNHNWKFFQAEQAGGKELWFYTCVNPQGAYANRELEMPLIKVRLIPWICYRYGVSGYLHWGYNFWNHEPNYQKFIKLVYGTGRPDTAPGDPWIVYPKLKGLGVNDSIRWEAQRDGCEDNELLSQLAERDRSEAQRLVDRQVQAFDRYDTNIADFRQTCRELLQALNNPATPEAQNKPRFAPDHRTDISIRSDAAVSSGLLMTRSRLNPAATTATVRTAIWRMEDDSEKN